MMVEELLSTLQSRSASEAYRALLELERLSDVSGELYTFAEQFADMTESAEYVMRVRGFRLFCKQAKWDTDDVVSKNLKRAMCVLYDEKPTAVRQALAALHDVARFKPELSGQIEAAINEINFLKYKESMQGLILNDIRALSEEISEIAAE